MSQLVYGLNTLSLTPLVISRSTAFYMRVRRYMLKIDRLYYLRISNQEEINRAIIELSGGSPLDLSWEQLETDRIARMKILKP